MDDKKRSGAPEPGSEFLAVRFAMSNLEQMIVNRLLNVHPRERSIAVKCILVSIHNWKKDVNECVGIGPEPPGDDRKDDDGGDKEDPKGPDCPKNWIPVGEWCIPPIEGE